MTTAPTPAANPADMTIVRTAEPLDVPIRWQANGAARVAPRVNLEFIVWSHRDGMRPEEIVESLPSLDLADVYAVIAYCLRHPEETEDYLRSTKDAEERARAELDVLFPGRHEHMARIRARRAAMQQNRQAS